MRAFLQGHHVKTAAEMHWEQLLNGDLLDAAETAFDVLINADQSIRWQQNLAGRHLAIMVLPTNRWPELRAHIPEIIAVVDWIRPGAFRQLVW